MEKTELKCQYCGKDAITKCGTDIYSHRPDLSKLKFKACPDCDAYVGCHKKTGEPLGTLANSELRKLRSSVHDKFDPLWQFSKMTRTKAYRMLSIKLNISFDSCHIGMFDEDTCRMILLDGFFSK